MGGFEGPEELDVVQVGLGPSPLVEEHRLAGSLFEDMADDRLERCHPRAPADEDHRLGTRLPVEEPPVGPGQADGVADLQRTEDPPVGGQPALGAPHVEFDVA